MRLELEKFSTTIKALSFKIDATISLSFALDASLIAQPTFEASNMSALMKDAPKKACLLKLVSTKHLIISKARTPNSPMSSNMPSTQIVMGEVEMGTQNKQLS